MSIDRIPDPEAYAERIGVGWPVDPTPDNLDRLILAHQLSVPYENIDCHDLGMVPRLDLGSLFHKVVVERRGGYCLELNRLFKGLLDEARYETYAVSCRARHNGLPEGPMLHRGTIVVADGRHLFCDVAFAGPEAPGAVPVGGSKTFDGETFSIRRQGSMWAMHRAAHGSESRLLEFWDMPVDEHYFEPINFYCARHEDSRFRRNRMMNIRLPDGSASLLDDTVTERRSGEVTVTSYADLAELSKAIGRVFGIAVHLEDRPSRGG